MPGGADLQLLGLALIGLVGGLVLFGRGLVAWRTGERLGDVPGTAIGTVPVGEVRLTGVVEPDVATLTSPLQGHVCVYYRSAVEEDRGRSRARVFAAERAVSFWLRDGSGRIRVLPRGARWAVPATFEQRDGLLGAGRGVGLPSDRSGVGISLSLGDAPHYEEATIEEGMTVTVLGPALPYGEVPDGEAAAVDDPGAAAAGDPEIAADLAAARARGQMASSPTAAWGNAAIPGFGIDRPTRAPDLDPAARPEALAPAGAAAAAAARFDITPDTLVVAAAAGAGLTVYAGPPQQAIAEQRWTFGLGLLGGALAVTCAVIGLLALIGRL